MYDLIIIGGGPAGASAAIGASRSGARVLLLERSGFPRHKVCGEFVSAESLGLLGGLLGSKHAALLDDALRICRSRVFLDGRRIETPINPPAASIARFDLDAALWEMSAQGGVDARGSTTVQQITGDGPFQVRTSSGEFEGRALMDASGRWSNLNAAPGDQGKKREKWLGVKAHFAEDSPAPSVDLYFFEGGYCGVQPVALQGDDSASDESTSDDSSDTAAKRGRVNACAMVRADVASTLASVFAQHPALAERARNWRPLTEPVTTSPLIFRDPRPLRGRVLLAGDAAGFVDPFVGDGISLALRSGTLAARCLAPFIRAEVSLEEAAAQYAQTYERELAPVFRASSKLRQALLLPRLVRAPILSLLQSVPASARYLVRNTRLSRPHSVET